MGAKTRGIVNLEVPLLHVKDSAHTDVSVILYRHYSTFLIKIHKRLVRRWMETDLNGLKNDYYRISHRPQQQQQQQQ
jgi:hypothetical protein